MARIKATTTDIFARLAKGECANFISGGCQGRTTPCPVINGEACAYFNEYVKPLLDVPEFTNKYGREARIAVALDPKAKVVRKRRDTQTPKLALEPSAPPKKPIVKPAKTSAPVMEPARRPEPAAVLAAPPRAVPAPPKPRTAPPKPIPAAPAPEQPQLLLELSPSAPMKAGKGRRR